MKAIGQFGQKRGDKKYVGTLVLQAQDFREECLLTEMLDAIGISGGSVGVKANGTMRALTFRPRRKRTKKPEG